MRNILHSFKCCWTMLAIFVTLNNAHAQTTVQIGTGTDVSSNPMYFPLYRLSANASTTDCRSNALFTEDELTAAGIALGSTITAIQFNKVNVAHFLVPVTYELYMNNSNRISLPTTDTWASITSTYTKVYNSIGFDVPNAAGWVTINVAPFVYTGGSLEIASLLLMTGNGGATDKLQWEYTASTPAVTDKVAGTTASNGTILNGTTLAYRYRPNIKFTFTPPPSCTTPPDAGTASSTLTTACVGEQFKLSLSSTSAGSGQTYQWQSSTDNVNWVNMGVPSISSKLNTSQSASTNYRCVVACSGQLDTSTVVLVSRPAPIHGTFSINSAQPTSGSNFQTFGDAINYIRCGIDGPVVFNVEPLTGPYNEQVSIPDVPGTSATSTITIHCCTCQRTLLQVETGGQ